MQSFAELLTKYTLRTGITDSELARSIGVRRQTIFRWKEGIVARPRNRDDVLLCAKRLRLTPAELDELLIAAGFRPDGMQEAGTSAHQDPLQDPLLSGSIVNNIGVDDVDDSTEIEEESTEAAVEKGLLSSTMAADAPYASKVIDADAIDPATIDPATIDPVSNAAARRSPTLWLASGALLLLALLAVVGFGSRLGAIVPWLGPPTPTATIAPVVQVLPTPTATPAATPIVVSAAPTQAAPSIVANSDETLLLVAHFGNYTGNAGYNVAGRIQKALQTEIEAATLGKQTKALIWREEIRASQQAEAIVAQSRAAMLIWGEYDSGRVVVNFAIRGDLIDDLDIEKRLQSPDELSPVINADIPKEVQSLALFTLGRLYLGEEKSTPARSALDRALRVNPPAQLRSEIHFQLGRAYGAGSSVADVTKAIAQYSKALAIRPLYSVAHYNRGNAYLKRHRLAGQPEDASATQTDLDLAINDYTKTLNIFPSYAGALINRGNAYYQRNFASDMDNAIADFDRAIALDPSQLLPYYNRGLARIRQGTSTEWQADFEKTIELNAEYLGAYTALCWGHALAQQPESALEWCQKAMDFAPGVGNSYDSIGLAYAQLGQSAEAIAAFEEYLAWLREQTAADYERYNGPLVEEWIRALEAGNQPITEEVLEGLR